MNEKKIIVCIPVYNASSTIVETLSSLTSQTYKACKIKIFDNASTDNSCEVISEYIKNFNYLELIKSEINIGGEGNFTRCIQAAEGDYTLVAHADDIYHQDFIKNAVFAFSQFPDSLAVFTRANFIDGNSQVTTERFFPEELMKQEITPINLSQLTSLVFKYANFITCPGVIVKSDVFLNHIKKWNGEQFKTSADLDVWFRIAERGNLLALNQVLINYRASDASYSFRIAKRRVTKHDMFLVLNFYREKLKKQLTSNDEINFQFLLMKDQALVTLNKMRSRIKLKNEDLFKIPFKILSPNFMKSKWHLKFSISILSIRFIAIFYSVIIGMENEQ